MKKHGYTLREWIENYRPQTTKRYRFKSKGRKWSRWYSADELELQVEVTTKQKKQKPK